MRRRLFIASSLATIASGKRRGKEFAQSTIDATIWLMCFHPERLPAWLERHPPGDWLVEEAQRQIDAKRRKRATEHDLDT